MPESWGHETQAGFPRKKQHSLGFRMELGHLADTCPTVLPPDSREETFQRPWPLQATVLGAVASQSHSCPFCASALPSMWLWVSAAEDT